MADSFFGFDTTLPVENDGGEEHEDELEYDALNDETFGAAINGDWEYMHENLVRLELDRYDKPKIYSGRDNKHDDGADLEINLSRVGLDDCEEVADDPEGRVPLDPSVWSSPIRIPAVPIKNSHDSYNAYNNSEAFLRQNFPQQYANQQQQLQQHQNNILQSLSQSVAPRMCTVEDIERNIRSQQIQQKQLEGQPIISPIPFQQQQQQQQLLQQSKIPNHLIQQHNQRMPPLSSGLPQIQPPRGHPGIYPQNIQGAQQPPSRLPPGFAPLHPLLNHMGGPMHGNLPRPMPPNMSMALNNFAMHPNFSSMRPPPTQIQPPGRLPHLASPQFQQNVQNSAVNVNQFNKRLVQEIQQNHPMLYFNRMNSNNNNNFNNNMNNVHHLNQNLTNGAKQMINQQQLQQQQQQQHQQQQQQQHQQQQRRDGNLNMKVFDEYANLMSTRDKQWLINIQLMQLNTDTPYIDDYYYTVFKERRAKMKGERESKAHKDNQLNHPFSQPKGHAHLVLISMGKNGTNQRNGHNRERKNSESANKNEKEQTPRTYTPLQFENSLGKLQCGSVTAPRKIIDMDIVGPDSGCQLNTTIELSAQRRSRQLLLHIETLYRIVLKMEDLQNPTAIAAAVIVKEKREKERQLALEQAMIDNVEKNLLEGEIKLDMSKGILNVAIPQTEKYPEPEGLNDLLPKLIVGLIPEKVIAMMTIRKGKTLLKRTMPLLTDNAHKWEVWCAIFSALPLIIKKDRDDSDGNLFALYFEFKNHLDQASLTDVLRISKSMLASDKKISYIFNNKFGVSCLIAIILKVESLFLKTEDELNSEEKTTWISFLCALASSVKPTQTQTMSTAIESDFLKSLIAHFSRFRDLKSQQLLAVLSQIETK